ncbi:MAG: hypothetical protein CBC00_05155 [Verrucomicrobia bacterium TMED40]|nr:MAG: hypothetical protein CBC00_05155 [Verrucomicrobia bacterium TMED40]|tara:strand:+ start:2343 stop:3104 length:762 start_codon:yes stop_codon:yes gene_type:complete
MIEMKIPERLHYLPCCLKCGKVDVGYKIQMKQGIKLKTCTECNGYVYLYKDFKITKDPERSKGLLFLATVGIFFYAVAIGQSTEFIFWSVFLAGLTFFFLFNHEKKKIKGVESLLLDYASLNPLKLYGQVNSDDSRLKLLHAGEEYESEVDDIPISFDPERQTDDDFFKWRADYLAGDPIRKHFNDAQIGETYKKMKEVDDIPTSIDPERRADDDFFKWRVDYLADDPIRKHFNDAQIGETYKKMKDAKGFEL